MPWRRLLPAGILIALFLGCGASTDGPPLVPVSGTVTLDGKALSGALVTFIPSGQTGGTDVSGRTDRQGRYELVSPKGRLGAVVGRYKVTVSRLLLPDGAEYTPDPDVPPIESPARESLPPHYSDADRTQLTATVAEGGGNIPFQLKKR